MALNAPIAGWPGTVAWLVGASSGIGRATAAALVGLGATVVASARRVEVLDAFVREHPGSEAQPLDVTDAAGMRHARDEIVRRHGRIDLTMYCAGHYRPMTATEFDLQEAQRHLQVNLQGALHWLDAVLPPLLRQADAGQRAHLSLVASVTGYRGLPKALAYGPTKAALINLAEVLYLDLAARGVAVSLINPGFVDTPLTARNTFAMPALLTPDQAAQAIVRGWQRGDFEIHFPRRLTWPMKIVQPMAHGLYLRAIRRGLGS